MKTAQLTTLYFIFFLGIMPISATAQPYTISTDGTEVTDKKTGLIWRRCTEGMVYSSGTCTGTASEFTSYKEALHHAAAQASGTGKAWRVPEKDELVSILDDMPRINPTAFPATPTDDFFWSASPGAGISAWVVGFGSGRDYGGVGLNVGSYVRLVRTGQ